MPPITPGRFAAHLEGDFVVFLIGMRINRLLLVNKWFPVSQSMPRMLTELFRQPELGLLHAQSFISWRTVMVLQYWRSFDHLHSYAHAKDKAHLPAWAAFNRAVGNNGSVGIFHETFLVKAGQHEAIYANMPPFGLGQAGNTAPAIGRMNAARTRLNQPE